MRLGSTPDRARAEFFLRANDPIVIIDTEGHYLDANAAACRLLGYTRAELLTVNSRQINGLSERAWKRVVEETFKTDGRIVDTQYRCKDGTMVPVEANVCRITYRGRTAIISVARDVSLHKKVEAQLVQRNLELESLLAQQAAQSAPWPLEDTPLRGADQIGTLDAILSTLVEHLRDVIAYDAAAFALYLPGTEQFVIRLRQEGDMLFSSSSLWSCSTEALEVLSEGRDLLLPDAVESPALSLPVSADRDGSSRGMVIPLRLRGRLLGVLCLSRHQQPGFTFEDADNLGRIRNQMAAAIDGACLLEELRALTVAEERSRLGREMHDRMGGALGSATAYSSAATEMLLAGQIADANWAVSEVSRSLQEAYLDLRESIEGLRTKEVEPEEWVESLQEYVKRYEAQWGIRCEFQVSEGAAEACGAQGRVGLTRILSEALTNVRKHTQTRHALVSIRLEDGSVLAQVTDEGQGFDPSLPMPGHYGLESMRERAGSLGGEVSVDTSALGTQLTVRLPARYIP